MQNTTAESTRTRKPIGSETHPLNPATEIQELIRTRAYQLYEQRGREDGHADDDWLMAESEILESQATKAAA